MENIDFRTFFTVTLASLRGLRGFVTEIIYLFIYFVFSTSEASAGVFLCVGVCVMGPARAKRVLFFFFFFSARAKRVLVFFLCVCVCVMGPARAKRVLFFFFFFSARAKRVFFFFHVLFCFVLFVL